MNLLKCWLVGMDIWFAQLDFHVELCKVGSRTQVNTQLWNHLVKLPLNMELYWNPEKMGHLHTDFSRVEEVLAWKFLTKLPMHWLYFLNHILFSVGHQKEIAVVGFYVQTDWNVDLVVSLYKVPKHWMLCSLWCVHLHEAVSINSECCFTRFVQTLVS